MTLRKAKADKEENKTASVAPLELEEGSSEEVEKTGCCREDAKYCTGSIDGIWYAPWPDKGDGKKLKFLKIAAFMFNLCILVPMLYFNYDAIATGLARMNSEVTNPSSTVSFETPTSMTWPSMMFCYTFGDFDVMPLHVLSQVEITQYIPGGEEKKLHGGTTLHPGVKAYKHKFAGGETASCLIIDTKATTQGGIKSGLSFSYIQPFSTITQCTKEKIAEGKEDGGTGYDHEDGNGAVNDCPLPCTNIPVCPYMSLKSTAAWAGRGWEDGKSTQGKKAKCCSDKDDLVCDDGDWCCGNYDANKAADAATGQLEETDGDPAKYCSFTDENQDTQNALNGYVVCPPMEKKTCTKQFNDAATLLFTARPAGFDWTTILDPAELDNALLAGSGAKVSLVKNIQANADIGSRNEIWTPTIQTISVNSFHNGWMQFVFFEMPKPLSATVVTFQNAYKFLDLLQAIGGASGFLGGGFTVMSMLMWFMQVLDLAPMP